MSVADMWNTYSTVQNHEDLADKVADLFADDVPAYKMAKKIKATNQTHKWTSDSLGAPSRTGIVEGATVTYTGKDFRTLNTNYTQIRLRSWEVTHTQMAVNTAGVKNDAKRELMKAMKELLRDFDKAILSTGAGSAGDTGTARSLRGIQSAVSTNSFAGTGTGSTSYVKLTEARVNSLLQDIWNQGGNPKALICGGYQKRVVSNNFTAKTGFTFNIESSARKAINNINQYEGSFGTLDIVPDRQSPGTRIAIIDPDMWRVAVLRDIEQHKGAKTSSSIKGWVEAEVTLNWGNEKGHGKGSYLTTTFAL